MTSPRRTKPEDNPACVLLVSLAPGSYIGPCAIPWRGSILAGMGENILKG